MKIVLSPAPISTTVAGRVMRISAEIRLALFSVPIPGLIMCTGVPSRNQSQHACFNKVDDVRVQ
ncbi:hypothetical protein [Burkholderia sp. ABCPW 14]|uniref:hypothetical protein n=1 Tax=Burkholderia sp. ABCPW 14 TaxID=1637860 RepID=UPI0018D27415|nr:hypothetical protein [Burkholderia sp. ABCPW 14]